MGSSPPAGAAMTERPAPSGLRIGDAERDATAGQLAEHFAQGRLTPGELEERLDRAGTARFAAELPALVADLPRIAEPAPRVPRPARLAAPLRTGLQDRETRSHAITFA